MAITKKKIREEENLIDAADAQPPAPPAQVPVPGAMDPNMAIPGSTPGPANPLMPPAPGMIPMSWGYPQNGAQAVAMETGDVNMAGAAPGGGVVEGQPISNEEAQLVTEYRSWSKQKRLEKTKGKLASRMRKTTENEEYSGPGKVTASFKGKDGQKLYILDDEADAVNQEPIAEARKSKKAAIKEEFAGAGAPDFGEEPEEAIAGNPFATEEDADIDVSDEMGEDSAETDEHEEEDAVDTLTDIAANINQLFADAGVDMDDVVSDEEEESDDTEEMPSDEDEEVEADEEPADKEEEKKEIAESRKDRIAAIRRKIEKARKLNRKKENKLVDQLSDEDYEAGADALFGDEGDDIGDAFNVVDEGDDDMFDIEDAPAELDPMNSVMEKKKRALLAAKRKKEGLGTKDVEIRFPAGTTPPAISKEAVASAYSTDEPAAMPTYEKRVNARREAILAARRLAASLKEMDDPDLSDADKTVECVVDEMPGEGTIKDKLGGKSRIVSEASTNKATRFVERYVEKQKLSFKDLLNSGLLG